jgi:hypothetical protein
MTDTERLELQMPKEFADAVDVWRLKQPDIPPRAEAIRRLVEAALAQLVATAAAREPEPGYHYFA